MNNTVFDINGKRIWVAGSRGMVGSALLRRMQNEDVMIVDDPHRDDLDLRDQQAVAQWMSDQHIDIILMAAARVGGIEDNRTHPADFIRDNIQIQTNIMTAAASQNIQKLVFLGSSCIYPKDAPQPIAEEALLSGYPEPTNRAYALAKIAGIELARGMRSQYGHDFISLMPCNLYGEGDNDDEVRAHVIPALLKKIKYAVHHNEDHITVWGTGKPLREFMHVDDAADAIIFCLKSYSDNHHLNIGTGEEMSIATLAETMCEIAGFKGDIIYDTSKPDGANRKILDSSRLNALGWKPQITVQEGLERLWSGHAYQGQQNRYQHG